MHTHFSVSTLLKTAAFFSGPTLFSGLDVSVKITTDASLDGIYFKRVDLPGQPQFKACLDTILDTPRTTILGSPQVHVVLVEHLLATLFVIGISKALIEIDGPEVPIGDGSALHIIKALENAGIEATEPGFSGQLTTPFQFEYKDQLVIGLPYPHFKISYLLQYPNHPLMDAQFYSFDMSLDGFKEEIAPCRTFALKQEVDAMIEKKILKGISLDYGLVLDQDKVLNPNGLRFSNEMARHKILDMIGDFTLAEVRPALHIVAIKSGHYANTQFAKLLKSHLKLEKHYGI